MKVEKRSQFHANVEYNFQSKQVHIWIIGYDSSIELYTTYDSLVKYFKWINLNNKKVINESDWSMADPNRIDKIKFYPTLNDVLVIKAQLSSTRRSNSYSIWSIWVIITRSNNLTFKINDQNCDFSKLEMTYPEEKTIFKCMLRKGFFQKSHFYLNIKVHDFKFSTCPDVFTDHYVKCKMIERLIEAPTYNKAKKICQERNT